MGTSAHCTTSKREPSLTHIPKPRSPTHTGREELQKSSTQSLIRLKTGAWTMPLLDQHGRPSSTRTSMSSTENTQVLLFNHKHVLYLDSTRNTSAHCTTSKREPSLIHTPKPRSPTHTGREELRCSSCFFEELSMRNHAQDAVSEQ